MLVVNLLLFVVCCLFCSDRSENMIKNEYMKLSRDASHRRLKSDTDVLGGALPAADEDIKKVCIVHIIWQLHTFYATYSIV